MLDPAGGARTSDAGQPGLRACRAGEAEDAFSPLGYLEQIDADLEALI